MKGGDILSIITSAHIGDIHFGAGDSNDLITELNHYFLKPCNKMPKLDNIFIEGDTYNHELSHNSRAVYNLMKFNESLESLAYKKNANLIYLKGTKSHDHNQLDNLLFKNIAKVKVINKVKSEMLLDDFRVLYLPEEYINDPKEYYSYYFDVPDDYYDMIIGHGSFNETSFSNHNSEIHLKSAPIYNSKELIRICRGLISFGHIHDAPMIKNRIFYTGSFSRWCQGEEKPKGFYFSLYDTETGNFKIIPVINKMARKYISRDITKFVRNNNVERCIDMVDSLLTIYNIFKLSLDISITNDKDMIFKSNILQKYFMNDKRVSININKLQLTDSSREKELELLEHFDYLFDRGLHENDKITIFINEEFNYSITKDRVEELLTEDIIQRINDELYQIGNGV
jgi:hypothetical protein